jgi:hypothetical protein
MSSITLPGILFFALRFAPFVFGLQAALLAAPTSFMHGSHRPRRRRVEGEPKTAASMPPT